MDQRDSREPENHHCDNCAAFNRQHADLGECRRHAPVQHRDLPAGEGAWPATMAGDWCLEWLPPTMAGLRSVELTEQRLAAD